MLNNDALITARVTNMRLRNLSPQTIRVNREAIIRLATFLDPTPLAAATDGDLNRWALDLTRLAPRTRYAEISRVACFYSLAVEIGHLAVDPARSLLRPRVPRSVPRPISEQRLALALVDAPADVFCYLMLAAFCGLRCMEIAALQRDSIREDDSPAVIVVNGKGAKERIVPLHPSVWSALRDYGLPHRGPVFKRRDGQYGAPSAHAVSILCNRWLHDRGIPDTVHSLRHRAITSVYRNSSDILVAQTFAGHSSPTTTAGYAAYCPESLVTAVMGIPRAVLA
jgi:integrase/recombinase XerC